MDTSTNTASPGGLGPAVRRGFRIVGWVCAALAAVVAVYGGIAIWQYHSQSQPPPNVATIARSASVTTADRSAVAEVDSRLATLSHTEPWLVPGPTGILDRCQSGQDGYYYQSWTPVTCARTVTAFYFFNGPFLPRMQAWNGALATAGWGGVQGQQILTQALSYYPLNAGSLSPQGATTAAPFSASELADAGACQDQAEGQRSVCLNIAWAERPRIRLGPFGDYQAVLGSAVVDIQNQSVNLASVETKAFDQYQYVVIATLSDTYYNPAGSPSSP